MRLAPRSLRARLVAGLLLLITLGILAADIAAVTALRSYLLRRTDEQLTAATGQVVDRLFGNGGLPPSSSDGRDQVAPTDFVIEVFDPSGDLTATIVDAGRDERDLPVLPRLDSTEVRSRGGTPFTVPSATDGADYRAVAVPLGQGRGSLVLSIPLTELASTTGRLVLIEVIVTAVVVALMGLLALLVVRVGLRPLTGVEGTARAIADGDLSRRVRPAEPGTEVGRLGLALNDMLGQIERAFYERRASEDRLRRFVADASHELRTPLTSIRGYAELYRQGAVTDPEQLTRAMGRIESEARRMGVLVDDLLLLARLDQHREARREPVDLADVVVDAVADLRAQQPQRPVTVSGLDRELPVLGDRHQLEQVLANLLGNVRIHVPVEASVCVQARVDPGPDGGQSAVVEVVDAGPGMPPEVAQRVFERFYRADAGRSRQQGGAGLGLAIVAAIVAAHGGTVSVRSEVGAGTAFILRLPLLAGPPEPPH